MSKIDFTFSTFPHYFRKHGWLDPKPDLSHMKMLTLLVWMFDRCSSDNRKIFHDHKLVDLAPYEFIFGRVKCAEQTGLTEKEVRVRLDWLLESNLLEKVASKTASKFTVYRWITEAFSENNGQQNGQQTASRRPADGHKEEDKKNKNKKKEERVADAPPLTHEIFLRPRISLTQSQFDKLKETFSLEQLDFMLDKLQFYFDTTAKKLPSKTNCYAYFRKGSWLLDTWSEHQSKLKKIHLKQCNEAREIPVHNDPGFLKLINDNAKKYESKTQIPKKEMEIKNGHHENVLQACSLQI